MVTTDDDAVESEDDAIFIDTNVLVFATIPKSPMHSIAKAELHAIAQSGVRMWISRQVIREFLVYLTRPGTLPVANPSRRAAEQAAALINLYRLADETSNVTDQLLILLRDIGAAGKHVHDANIVATMRVNGIRQILTDNVKDFRRYMPHITILPLPR